MSTNWKIKEFLNRYEDYKLGYMVIFKGEELKSLLEEVWTEAFNEGKEEGSGYSSQRGIQSRAVPRVRGVISDGIFAWGWSGCFARRYSRAGPRFGPMLQNTREIASGWQRTARAGLARVDRVQGRRIREAFWKCPVRVSQI